MCYIEFPRFYVGYELYGLKLLREFPEHYVKSYTQKRWKYYEKEYYVLYDCGRGVGPEPFIFGVSKLNRIAYNLIRNRKKPKCLKSNKVKMLDKKYES